jgi:membrane-bound lytic murein transglycosylase D
MFGDWSLAIAAYNCGEGNVQKALIRSGNQDGADFWSIYDRLPRETRGYVPAFIAATYIMNYYCEHGIVPHEASLPLESDTVVVQRDVKFSQIASKCNITIDELRAINPQYRKDIVPADYVLRLPAGTIEEFLVKEDSIYGVTPGSAAFLTSTRRSVVSDVEEASDERAATTASDSRSYTSSSRSNASSSRSSKSKSRSADKKSRSSRDTRSRKQRTQSVSVKSGDTLSSIAKKNGTTVAKLKKMNGLKGDVIHPGQSVRVK